MERLAFKLRLYPTSAQETALEAALEVCRGVYNSFLHWRTFAYETAGKSPTRLEQEKALTLWKLSHPELKTVHAHLLQNVAVRVERAFDAFFRRVQAGEEPGYPRFKGHGQYDSLTWKEYGNGCRLNAASVMLSKIGDIKAVVHRDWPGVPKTCTVRRQAGKWFACFSCEVEAETLPASAEVVGVDVGLNQFAAHSNGELIANPRFFRKDEKALAKASRKFDKVKNQHRSQARKKAKKVVARIHERIRNRRHDFIHQTSRRLVNRFGFIVVEALQVENMVRRPKAKPDEENPGAFLPNGACRKSGLNKSIADAAWTQFRFALTYKAESAGRELCEVNPAYTSQDCSECGYRVVKTLSERVHLCPCCGLTLDRDVNAARNILKIAVGLHSVPARQDRSHADLSAVE